MTAQKSRPWWRDQADEIERQVACGKMSAMACFTKMQELLTTDRRAALPAEPVARTPLSDEITDTERLEHLIVADALVCEWVSSVGSTFTLMYATSEMTLESRSDTADYTTPRAAIDAAISVDRQLGITQEKQG